MTPSAACAFSAASSKRPHSTGKERDAESGNDYFGARYYASSMGRFMSPDWALIPAPVPFANLDDPQSLNLYSYVLNSPLTVVDANGHESSSEACMNEMSETGEATGISCQSWATGNLPGHNVSNSPYSTELDQAESRHLSIINNDFDPEGIAHDSIGYQFSGGDGTLLDRDKQYDALAIGQRIGRGLSPDQVKDKIQYIYDHLQLSGVYTGGLHGGNFNFNPQIGTVNLTDFFNTGRNGIIPSVHIETDPNTGLKFFHVDTANGISIAGPIHWFVDELLGNTIFQSGIPR